MNATAEVFVGGEYFTIITFSYFAIILPCEWISLWAKRKEAWIAFTPLLVLSTFTAFSFMFHIQVVIMNTAQFTAETCAMFARFLPLTWGMAQAFAFLFMWYRSSLVISVVPRQWQNSHRIITRAALIVTMCVPAATILGMVFWSGLLGANDHCIMYGPIWITALFLVGSTIVSTMFMFLFVIPVLYHSTNVVSVNKKMTSKLRGIARWNLWMSSIAIAITISDMTYITLANAQKIHDDFVYLNSFTALSADGELIAVGIIFHVLLYTWIPHCIKNALIRWKLSTPSSDGISSSSNAKKEDEIRTMSVRVANVSPAPTSDSNSMTASLTV